MREGPRDTLETLDLGPPSGMPRGTHTRHSLIDAEDLNIQGQNETNDLLSQAGLLRSHSDRSWACATIAEDPPRVLFCAGRRAQHPPQSELLLDGAAGRFVRDL